MTQQSWCMSTNRSMMVTRGSNHDFCVSPERWINDEQEGRAPHNFQFDNVFTRNMKFSILTLVFLSSTASAVLGQEVSSIRGRKATQARLCTYRALMHEVCTSDLNACPDTNPFVCLDGKAKSWCTANGLIWLNAEGCHECRGLPFALFARRRNQRRNPKAVDRACSKFALRTWMLALTPTHLPVSMARQRVAALSLNTFGWTPRFVTSAATFCIVQGRARHIKSRPTHWRPD
jgi:hypothetical protein